MASGWILWVRLECIGVASRCCCKEVYRFPHNITYPYLLLCSFISTCFFVLVYVIFVQYSKRCSMNIQGRSKIDIIAI